MEVALRGRRVPEAEWRQLRALIAGTIAGERALAAHLLQSGAAGGTVGDLGALVQGALGRPGP